MRRQGLRGVRVTQRAGQVAQQAGHSILQLLEL
jgi:hypothetical protein